MAPHLSSRDFAAQGLLTASASTYAIIAGNTGSGIAGKLRVSFEQVPAANAGVNWNSLQTGQTMHLSDLGGGTQRYAVLGGDAGFAIAQRFGISFDQLSAANHGVAWNNLPIGQVLIIPSGRAAVEGKGGGGGTGPIPLNGFGHIEVDPMVCYSGLAANFPNPLTWQKWSLMWARNSGVIRINDAPQEVALIEQAITSVAQESGIDCRVVLAMTMQESLASVRVNATYSVEW